MENFIIAILIVAVVLLFTAINSVIVCNICDELTDLTNQGEFEKAFDLWQEKKDYLSLFIRDAEIDVVTAEFNRSKQSIAFEDGEAEADLTSLKEAIFELKQSEFPRFFNIF